MSNGDSALGGGQLLPIGALAELTGKRPSSIRYYEQIGLLPQPVRIAGRRMYDPATVRTLAMIETGQRAGLALDEIKALLSASREDRAAIERLRELADRKLPEIVALIQRSELVRDWLECAARCECPDLDECPLFDEPSPLPRPASGKVVAAAPNHARGQRLGIQATNPGYASLTAWPLVAVRDATAPVVARGGSVPGHEVGANPGRGQDLVERTGLPELCSSSFIRR